MKYLKMLALAAVAAGALMAFIGAGTASATVFCSTTTGNAHCPAAQRWGVQPLKMSIPSGSSALLVDTSGETTLDKCTSSTVEGEITNAGSESSTVTGTVSSLSWGGCTFPTNTLEATKLECHWITGTSNCTATADGSFRVTINTIFFGSCIYGVTSGTSIGDITEGKPGVFHANAVAERFSGSNFACPETSKWTGTYNVTTPSETTLSVSTG